MLSRTSRTLGCKNIKWCLKFHMASRIEWPYHTRWWAQSNNLPNSSQNTTKSNVNTKQHSVERNSHNQSVCKIRHDRLSQMTWICGASTVITYQVRASHRKHDHRVGTFDAKAQNADVLRQTNSDVIPIWVTWNLSKIAKHKISFLAHALRYIAHTI